MGFCLLGFVLYSNARSSLRVAVNEVNELVEFSEKLHRQLSKADRDMRRLERELAALDAIEQKREDEEVEERVLSQSSAFANPKLIEEMNNIQRKLRYSQTKADKLKTQVSEISKRDAIAKYGSGVVRVQMDLIFPTSEDNTGLRTSDNGPHTIVIEMASLDLMPHSVYTFLEMVSSGLLNGCSFILNALHVLKAAPLPYDGTSASDKARAFLEHGLESVAFREYTPEFPHSKYTVGFAADGSPSFYINTEDNTEIHVGDPCFAKVISGFDTIQRLEKMPTRNGIWFEHRIGIKEVTIL
jgi:cyclophilin family peptidyl-prolyl cis-trans isomerase